MADQLMEIVDGLVSLLQEAFPTVTVDGSDYRVSVEWTPSPVADLATLQVHAPLIWVLDAGESLETAENGIAIERFTILLVLQMKLDGGDDEAQVARDLSALASDIARSLKAQDENVEIADAICQRVERRQAKDREDWSLHGRFYAELMTTWVLY